MDPLSSLSVSQIKMYQALVPFPLLPLRADECKNNSVNTIICKYVLKELFFLNETQTKFNSNYAGSEHTTQLIELLCFANPSQRTFLRNKPISHILKRAWLQEELAAHSPCAASLSLPQCDPHSNGIFHRSR